MPLAFIVDGLTEKKIIQKLCKGTTVRTLGLNGKDVALSAIAKAAFSLISLFKGRHYPVVLVIDREGRVETSEQIETTIRTLLVEYGVTAGDVIISCPDRMIENWMLGDDRYFEEVYGIKLTETYEGSHGKRDIRRLLQQKGISYHEVALGVDIFCNIDPALVSRKIISFNRFKATVGPFCPWLRSPWQA
jgi:hypothetical protein